MKENTATFKFPLGIEAWSNLSGFRGIVISRSENLNQCNRYYIAPKVDKDGKLPDGYYFDENEIETERIHTPTFIEFKHPLGVEAESNITGMRGIIIACSIHINGCFQYFIKPRVDRDGKLPDGSWLNENEVVIIKSEQINRGKKTTGGFPSRIL